MKSRKSNPFKLKPPRNQISVGPFVGITYDNVTGISDAVDDTHLNYSISASVSDYHFVSGAWNKNQDNIELNGAYQSFKNIVEKLDTKYIMISYSNESIVSKQQMTDLLKKYGKVEILEIDHKRNVMGAIGFSKSGQKIYKSNPNVTEYIFLLEKKIYIFY